MEIKEGKKLVLDEHWITNGELQSVLRKFPENSQIIIGVYCLNEDFKESLCRCRRLLVCEQSGEDIYGHKVEGVYIHFDDGEGPLF